MLDSSTGVTVRKESMLRGGFKRDTYDSNIVFFAWVLYIDASESIDWLSLFFCGLAKV